MLAGWKRGAVERVKFVVPSFVVSSSEDVTAPSRTSVFSGTAIAIKLQESKYKDIILSKA